MHYSFATLAAIVLGGFAAASPTISGITTIGAHTSLNATLHADGVLGTIMLFCTIQDCQQCFALNLEGQEVDTCIAAPTGNVPILSAGVVQTSGFALPFTPAVGTAGCGDFQVISPVGECVIMPAGPPFITFALLD